MSITTDDFYEYGKWARDCSYGLDVKPQWFELIMKDNVDQPTREGYNMTDEKADKIDKAVCALCNYDVELGDLFKAHYIADASERKLSKVLQVPRTKIKKDLSEAGGFVLGVVATS